MNLQSNLPFNLYSVNFGFCSSELPDAIKAGTDPALMGPIAAGVVVAAISGFFAIKTMIKIVSNKKLSYFSYYVWVLGIFTVVYGVFFAKIKGIPF